MLLKGDRMSRRIRGKTLFSVFAALCLSCVILCTGCGSRKEEAEPAVREGKSLPQVLSLPVTAGTENDGDVEDAAAGETKQKEEASDNGTEETVEAGPDTPLLEQLFTYEEKSDWGWGGKYLSITGAAGEYEPFFWQYMEEIRDQYGSKWYLKIPSDINGVPVWEIAAGAFEGWQMYGALLPDSVKWIGEDAFRNTGVKDIALPANLESIGARAFEGCNLERLALPDCALSIEEKAFAGNEELRNVLIPDVEARIGENVFEGCDPELLICYGVGQEEKHNRVSEYAKENGFESRAVIVSKEPVVRYHDEPPVLKPAVRNFFYGDDAEDELWCTWDEDENAPNFGYPDWQWSGCSSWCGCIDFVCDVEASSELPSSNERYAAENIWYQSREAAWAEGVDGPGIGESITVKQGCTYFPSGLWENYTPDNPQPVPNSLYHYTEICIVNGYAKDRKTWVENGRIKRLAMYVEGRLYAYLELEDTILPQYFVLPVADIIVPNASVLEVRFVIEDVYPGSLYDDTCLTGLVMEFAGRSSH